MSGPFDDFLSKAASECVNAKGYEATETRRVAQRYRETAALWRRQGKIHQARDMDLVADRFEAQALELEREHADD